MPRRWALRVAVLGCVALGAAGLRWGGGERAGQRIVLEDRSVSFAPRLGVARSALRRLVPAPTAVLPFAARVGVQREGRGTDLAAAVRAALQRLGGRAGDIVALTDARPTRGGWREAVREAARRGVPIHGLCPPAAELPSLAITAVRAPAVVRRGEGAEIELQLRWNGLRRAYAPPSEAPLHARITARLGDSPQPVADAPIVLPGGGGRGWVRLALPPGALATAGGRLVRVVIEVAAPLEHDASPLDDRAVLEIWVPSRRPLVWLVAGEAPPAGAGRGRPPLRRLGGWLAAAGCEVRERSVADLSLASPRWPELVVLYEVGARELGAPALARLRRLLRLGGSLAVLGGRNAFGPGGYDRSGLEPLLPVRSRPELREHRPLWVVVVLDRSGSMARPTAGGASKYERALEALAEVAGVLGPEDRLAVLAFSDRPSVLLPLGAPPEPGRLRARLRALRPGGPTALFEALEDAVQRLRAPRAAGAGSAPLLHVVVLSDGRAEDAAGAQRPQALERLVALARAAPPISISTVAIGPDADRRLLGAIAARTGGLRYDVPSLDGPALRQALERALDPRRAALWIEGPVAVAPGPDLGRLGLGADRLGPTVQGAARTAARAGAAVAAVLASGAPLFAWWTREAGAVAAYPSPDLASQPALLTSGLRHLLPARPPGELRIWRERERDAAVRVWVDRPSVHGGGAAQGFELRSVDRTAPAVRCVPVAPGRWRSPPLDPATRGEHVALARVGQPGWLGLVRLVPPVEETAFDEPDRAVARWIAQTTGGRWWIDELPDALPAPPAEPAAGRALAPVWLLLAAALFVLERAGVGGLSGRRAAPRTTEDRG